MTLLTPPRPMAGSVPRNGLTWKPYRYGGDDGADTLTPEIDAMPLEAFDDRAAPECGTPSAYRRHLRKREPVDEACRVAESARQAAYRERRGNELRAAKYREARAAGMSAAEANRKRSQRSGA